jgi:hypothetical protein
MLCHDLIVKSCQTPPPPALVARKNNALLKYRNIWGFFVLNRKRFPAFSPGKILSVCGEIVEEIQKKKAHFFRCRLSRLFDLALLRFGKCYSQKCSLFSQKRWSDVPSPLPKELNKYSTGWCPLALLHFRCKEPKLSVGKNACSVLTELYFR